MTPSKFKSILKTVAKGNGDKFVKIYNEYYNAVYFAAYSVLLNSKSADDVAQSVLYTVYRNAEKFADIKNHKLWLYNYSINEAKSYAKGGPCREVAATNDDDAIAEKLAVERVLREESSEEKEIFIKKFYFDLSFEGIAKEKGIEYKTVEDEFRIPADKLREDLTKE